MRNTLKIFVATLFASSLVFAVSCGEKKEESTTETTEQVEVAPAPADSTTAAPEAK